MFRMLVLKALNNLSDEQVEPRSRPNSGPVVTTVGFIDAVGVTIRCL
jgi:hypothetical protein